jgi:ATP-binding cassette subfamily B protein
MKKVKPFLQYSAVECGACSLAAILRFYGYYTTIPVLRNLLGVNRDGSKAADILRTARSFGLVSKGMKIPTESFKENNFPCIIFWEFNHFLVLEGFKNGRAFLSNPALGRHSVLISDFNSSYSGVALLFTPGPDFRRDGKSEPSLYTKILGIPIAYPQLSCLVLLISVIAVIPQLFIASASSQFLNLFLGQGKAYIGMPVVVITIAAIGITLMSSLASQTLIRRLQYIISKKTSVALFKKLFASSFSYLSQRSATELSSRMTMGLQYSQSVIGIFYSYLSVMLQAIIVTIFMLFISYQLTFLCVGVIVCNLIATDRMIKARSDDNKKLAIASAKASSNGYLSLINIETVKSSGIEPLTFDKWLDEYVPVVGQTQDLGAEMNKIGTLSRGSTMFLDFAVLCYGSYLILQGEFTLGGLLAFQFLSGLIQAPLGSITSLGEALQSIDGIIGRLQDLDNSEVSPLVSKLEPSEVQYEEQINSTTTFVPKLEATSVSFKFGTHLPLFFDDINLVFKPGSHTTIVGTSGSGKSTFIKILAGLIEPCQGSVQIDTKSVAEISQEARADIISYVAQDSFLFDGTIRENITLWDPSIRNNDIFQALKDSQIYDKINSFPMSIETIISTFSSKLSGGEQQRLCIARALARNPKILLLDEATSALDSATEKSVLYNIYNRKITTISVAHRLYTALISDNVIVLESGQIVEHGSPQDLMSRGGIFSRLVQDEEQN